MITLGLNEVRNIFPQPVKKVKDSYAIPRPVYSKELKLEVATTAHKLRDNAGTGRKYGISTSTVRKWVSQMLEGEL